MSDHRNRLLSQKKTGYGTDTKHAPNDSTPKALTYFTNQLDSIVAKLAILDDIKLVMKNDIIKAIEMAASNSPPELKIHAERINSLIGDVIKLYEQHPYEHTMKAMKRLITESEDSFRTRFNALEEKLLEEKSKMTEAIELLQSATNNNNLNLTSRKKS